MFDELHSASIENIGIILWHFIVIQGVDEYLGILFAVEEI